MKFNGRFATLVFLLCGSVGQVCISQQAGDKLPSVPALLLPHASHVKGQVVGEDGKPIDNVLLVYLNPSRVIRTGSNGEFEFDTAAPSFVAKKPGYESAFVRNDVSAGFRVVLRRLPLGTAFPVCTAADLADRAHGWRGVLQLPKTGFAKAHHERPGTDYWLRSVRVKSDSTTVFAYQGRGPMWGGGMSENDIWGAARYSGKAYELDGWSIDDAKVWLPNGTCSRILGTFRESVFYSRVDCRKAKPLDHLIDKVCVDHDAFARLIRPPR